MAVVASRCVAPIKFQDASPSEHDIVHVVFHCLHLPRVVFHFLHLPHVVSSMVTVRILFASYLIPIKLRIRSKLAKIPVLPLAARTLSA